MAIRERNGQDRAQPWSTYDRSTYAGALLVGLLTLALGHAGCKCTSGAQTDETPAMSGPGPARPSADHAQRPIKHPPMPEPPPPQFRPLEHATLGDHLRAGMRVRVWRRQAAGDGGTGGLDTATLVSPGDVHAMKAAVGIDQTPAKSACERCAPPLRIVFENPLGLHVGAIELGCDGPERARFRLGPGAACGTIKLADRAAVERLANRARPGTGTPPMLP